MKNTPAFRFFLLIILIIVSWNLGRAWGRGIEDIRAFLSHVPAGVAEILFVGIYVAVTALIWFGTIDFFRITGALLFGPYVSSVLVWIAETANATILFHISRALGRGFIQEKFHLKDSDLRYAKAEGGFLLTFVLRINPLVPFRLMDVGFGLSAIEFKKYFWAVVTASPLRIFWLQFIIAGVGEAMFRDLSALIQFLQQNQGAILLNGTYFLVVFLVTIIGGIVGLTRKVRRDKRKI